MHRSVCYQCHKAAVVCVCPDIRLVRNQTGIVILQHPRERFHPIGTARFARLGLENVRIIIDDIGRDLDLRLPPRTGLLHRAPGARLLSEVRPEERPEHLLLLDGTWPQARSTYKRHRSLAELPQFDLAPKQSGQYRIRLEPDERSLSTIEAIIHALEILEPETEGLDDLLAAFTRMIDRQIDWACERNPRRRLPRVRPRRASIFGDRPERVVLGYGELALPPGGPGTGPYALIYWSALRMMSGETFEAFVRPHHFSSSVPSDRQLGHMGFSREQVSNGCSIDDFRERWRAFLKDDVLAVWNKSTLDFLESECALPRTSMSLKAAYCNAKRSGCGSLDDVLRAEGLTEQVTPFIGRPRVVMSQLWSVALWLHSLAR